ncbi:ATP-dependent DNA helicase DinG [Thalassorhabdus alkalitolerans]|uniref:3'-5' exonuclease DinG n=1 Tax=Thalassorhabdus alkalitolerans TaxID=2282697 RepID=A0ABW0YV62_9BACI
MTERYVIIDVETTGNAPKKGDRIIQIGAVAVENEVIVDSYSSFFNPGHSIPSFIQQLTGITDNDVADAPLFEEQVPRLLTFLEGSYFVAHNVPFDLSFINGELERAGYEPFGGPVIDTVECARLLYPTEASYQLNQLADTFSVVHDRPHQADSDAEVTAIIWMKLKKKLEELPAATLHRLLPLSKHLESEIEPIIQSALREKVKADAEDPAHIEVYRQIALKRKTPFQKRSQKQPDGEQRINSNEFFKQEGHLARAMNKYEYRSGQEDMSASIHDAFNQNSHLLVEAGTGTGKSLAYLLPAVEFAKQTNRPVIVSTQTITLQDQLMAQEIPLLQKALPYTFDVSLLKGRSHYLCLRKFEQLLDEQPEHYEQALALGQLLVWLTETEYGDVEELNLVGGASRRFWDQVKSDGESCTGPSCPWFSRCFYQQARERAFHGDIVVTNHALLFTDMVHDQSLLPGYRHAVIDEAHHLEQLASQHLGIETDYTRFTHLIHRLGTMDNEGLLAQSVAIIPDGPPIKEQGWVKARTEKLADLKFEIDELFRMLHGFCLGRSKRGSSEVGRLSIRFSPSEEKGLSAIQEGAKRVVMLLEEEGKKLLEVGDHIDQELLSFQERGIVSDFLSAVRDLLAEGTMLEKLLLEEDPNMVYWMEAESKGAQNATYLYARPIDVSELLADKLFAKKDSVIMTSATLTVKNSFRFIKKRLGLDDFGVETLSVPSPFNYQRQAKLLIPEDMGSIKRADEKAFIEQTAEFIYHSASITQGRMLVLFTSFDMLRKTYRLLREWDDEGDFVLIGQGVKTGSRTKLMKTFRQHERSILLGTSTFWEGVDIPGDALSCLVIVRLPFSPPDEPVLQAKSEKVKAEGKNPFSELSLPQAVLRFKQGFGRLIRQENDKGVVVVLDKRLLQSSYGKDFIRSLPKVPVIQKPMDEVLNEIDRFLNE